MSLAGEQISDDLKATLIDFDRNYRPVLDVLGHVYGARRLRSEARSPRQSTASASRSPPEVRRTPFSAFGHLPSGIARSPIGLVL